MGKIRKDFIKAERVVESCTTKDQLRAAKLYADLTAKRYTIRYLDSTDVLVALLRGRLSKLIHIKTQELNGIRL